MTQLAVGEAFELEAPTKAVPWLDRHPLVQLVLHRALTGIVTLFVVSVVVFAATEVLPGNAATVLLGHNVTPQHLRTLDAQLHLNRSLPDQYWLWLTGMLSGNPGKSLTNGYPIWGQTYPRLVNSAMLAGLAGLIGTVIGVVLGAISAIRKDSWFDHATSLLSLAATSLPEFVVGVILVLLFATVVFHLFPGVSVLPPGAYAWDDPDLIVLPAATLVIVIVPYIHRMMRASMIEALESDYVEMAHLKGVPEWRIVLIHAFPNAIAPTIQVIGLTYLYLAGGIVVVEEVFNYQGVGQGLVNAVSDRDIPIIQLIVMVLATFYVLMNIFTDVIALLATPRRRIVR